MCYSAFCAAASLILCLSTANGQSVTPAAVESLSVATATESDSNVETYIQYGLPLLRKAMPAVVYPPKAAQFGIEGRVTVQFVLKEDGRAADLKILKGIGHGCDEEVLRVLKASRFQPHLDEGGTPRTAMFVAAFDFQLDA